MVYMYHSFLVHSSADGHLGCFHVLAMTNSHMIPLLMADNEKELKSLLMKVKGESEKAGLNSTFKKPKNMASGPITSWQIDGKTMETSDRLYFLGLQNLCGLRLQS